MKGLLKLLFLTMISVNSFSQDKSEIVRGILEQIGKNMSMDQLFLHIDRTLYNCGDTIRFQAFIRDRQTGVIETPSKSLMVLLLNSEHVVIDSARFRISYSTASGWLKIPEIIPVGYYSILAYTSDQMNYDPRFAFHSTIRIDRINPNKRNNNLKDTLSKASVDLRFLPEGGTFIYGIRQRLAFNAVSSTGKNVSVSGDIVNQDGKKIIDFKSGQYGPGVVDFTPIPGESYYAKPIEKEFGNLSWPLPEPEKSGVSLRVNNTQPGSIDILVSGDGIKIKEYFLTVTLNNILIFSKDLELDTLFNVRIKTTEIPAGTAFVTLFDNELNPVAERMIFLNPDKKMKIQAGVSKPNFRPGSETELVINTIDEQGNNLSSIISVAAIDSSLGFYNSLLYNDIESIFLFDNEFYNNLPQSIKCIGLNNIDNKSIDLLMMTYGWRKYTLKESAQIYQEKRSNDYDLLKLRNPGKEKKSREVINILSLESGDVITFTLNENRETLLPFDSLDFMARQIMILPDDDPARNSNPVIIEFPENSEYSKSVKQIETDSSYFESEYNYINYETPLFNPDSAIMVDAVTIKGNRKPTTEYVDKNAEQFKYAGAYTLYSKDFEDVQTFEDVLYKLGAYNVDKKNKKVILRAIQYLPKQNVPGSSGGRYRPALFVVDDIPIYDNTYYPISQMKTTDIASITVLKGPQGFAVYGNSASNGAILVTTKTGNKINGIINPNDKQETTDNHLQQVRLFRSEIEYYTPTKEQIEFVPEYQFRPTLLWKSDVFLDGSGPIKFQFPNNLGKGTVMVFVNGVSITNQVGTTRLSYKVK